MLGDVGPQAAKQLSSRQACRRIPYPFREKISACCWLSVICSPVVLAAGTTEPFTSIGKKSRLRLSSSGGGLFDGRPKTQTWVWGAFVFSAGNLAAGVSISSPTRWRAAGQCPLDVQIPKRIQFRRARSRPGDRKRRSRLSGTIHAGYRAFEAREGRRQLSPGSSRIEIRPPLPQAFHSVWQWSCRRV